MMFKYSEDLVPLAIVEFLPEIMSFTITIQDKVNHFILQLAETKRSIKYLHTMALEFGITYQQQNKSVEALYVSFQLSSKLLI